MALSTTHTSQPPGPQRPDDERENNERASSRRTGGHTVPRGPETGLHILGTEKNRPRPLVRLGSSRLPAVHQPPINPVVCRGSYWVKPMRRLILGRASHLDAVSGYPCRTWLPSHAGYPTTGTPAVRPARSSRTRASSPQPSKRPRRIETELSHDVLNPARVPL